MRIIAGIARGLPLVAPRTADVRPTSDRVREAIFSSLGERVAGADVLDLYAGSGALGLEAASRGAHSVVFIERSRNVALTLERNIAKLRQGRVVECKFSVECTDVAAGLAKLVGQGREFSLIFADPPYGQPLEPVLAMVDRAGLLAADGAFVFESAKRDALVVPAGWTVGREAVYGDTRVSFLRRA
jgi:16S rRNA (guanine966-N2)-methyltransferase